MIHKKSLVATPSIKIRDHIQHYYIRVDICSNGPSSCHQCLLGGAGHQIPEGEFATAINKKVLDIKYPTEHDDAFSLT